MEFIRLMGMDGMPVAVRPATISHFAGSEEDGEGTVLHLQGSNTYYVRETVEEILGMLEGRGPEVDVTPEMVDEAMREGWGAFIGKRKSVTMAELREMYLSGRLKVPTELPKEMLRFLGATEAGEKEAEHGSGLPGEMVVENSSGRAAEAGEEYEGEKQMRRRIEEDRRRRAGSDGVRATALIEAIECVQAKKNTRLWPAADTALDEILTHLRRLRAEIQI